MTHPRPLYSQEAESQLEPRFVCKLGFKGARFSKKKKKKSKKKRKRKKKERNKERKKKREKERTFS